MTVKKIREIKNLIKQELQGKINRNRPATSGKALCELSILSNFKKISSGRMKI